jgi:hypothetical protein
MKLLIVRSTAIAVLAASPMLALFLACGNSSGGGNGGSSSGSGSGGSSGSSGSSSGSSGSSSGGLPTGTPSITITSPMAGASVAVTPPTDYVLIGFTVTNFELEAAGTCMAMGVPATSDNCGHIHVLVDGNDCTPDGAPYNNATGAPPVTSVQAILSECPMVNGSHTAQLQLHHDDHSPIDNDAGVNIAASVTFTATGG